MEDLPPEKEEDSKASIGQAYQPDESRDLKIMNTIISRRLQFDDLYHQFYGFGGAENSSNFHRHSLARLFSRKPKKKTTKLSPAPAIPQIKSSGSISFHNRAGRRGSTALPPMFDEIQAHNINVDSDEECRMIKKRPLKLFQVAARGLISFHRSTTKRSFASSPKQSNSPYNNNSAIDSRRKQSLWPVKLDTSISDDSFLGLPPEQVRRGRLTSSSQMTSQVDSEKKRADPVKSRFEKQLRAGRPISNFDLVKSELKSLNLLEVRHRL